MAIAESKMMAAFGYVNWERAKKDEEPRSRYRALRVCKYRPNPAIRPDQIMTNTPSAIPIRESARGIARTPAPRTTVISVYGRAQVDIGFWKYTRIQQIYDAAHPACLTDDTHILPPSTKAMPGKKALEHENINASW